MNKPIGKEILKGQQMRTIEAQNKVLKIIYNEI